MAPGFAAGEPPLALRLNLNVERFARRLEIQLRTVDLHPAAIVVGDLRVIVAAGGGQKRRGQEKYPSFHCDSQF